MKRKKLLKKMPNIAKRLKNLWKLSAYEPQEDNTLLPVGTKVVQQIVKKPAMAQIIRMKNPVDEALNNG